MKNLNLKTIIILLSVFINQHITHASPNTTRITLTISDTSNEMRTNRIIFSDGIGYTTGLDEGYDAGAFGSEAPGTGFQDRFGNSLSIYTLLVKDDLGKELGFTIQSLPYSQINNMIVALGINPSKDDNITISAAITDFEGKLSKFPDEHRLILEDRALGVYTELQEIGSSYIVYLTQNEPELGRFYLHTTTNTILELNRLKQKKNSPKKSIRVYGCKDKKAKNYNRFSKHKQSKCKYQKEPYTLLTSYKKSPLVKENKQCIINYSRLLKKGMKGEDVQQFQSCLLLKGYDIGLVDGIFGKLTYGGVISYQSLNQLYIDGIIGPQTVGHLNNKTQPLY